MHNCLTDATNDYLVKPKTIKNSYAKDQSRKQIKLQTIDQFIDKARMILNKHQSNKNKSFKNG